MFSLLLSKRSIFFFFLGLVCLFSRHEVLAKNGLTSTGTITIVQEASPSDGTDFTFVTTQPVTTPHHYVGQMSGISLDTPRDVEVDGWGFIYVVDTEYHRVVKFDPAGNFLSTWGTQGSGNGQFQEPKSIAIDVWNDVYIADYQNNRVQKFDHLGNYLRQWGGLGEGNGQFTSPEGVAVDLAGNVYVADTGNDRIQKFDREGHYLGQWGGTGSGNGQLNFPVGVAVDHAGNLYVADVLNHRIQQFDAMGSYLRQWGIQGSGNGQFNFPVGVAVDSAGNVYVADNGNQRIQKFTATGSYILQWGNAGSGDGAFNLPTGITIDRMGYFYVADRGNDRVQRFALPVPMQFKLDDAMPDDGDGWANSITWMDVPIGEYEIQQLLPTGWLLVGLDCTTDGVGDLPFIAGTKVSIALDSAETVTCTYQTQPSSEQVYLSFVTR